MSDAVNMMALAKMAVVVIGVFMVPMITRKFAADLGVPVGQMAMNRAALASAALGVGAVKIAAAGSGSLLSHGAAASLPKVGSTLRSVAQSLNPIESPSSDPFSSPSPKAGVVRRASAATLEKLGKHLEEAKLRHDAKKAGVQPPTLKDQFLKRMSVDPQVTGAIHEREQRYQKFLKSRNHSPELPSSQARTSDPRSTSSLSSYSHTSPDRGSASFLGDAPQKPLSAMAAPKTNTMTSVQANLGRTLSQQSAPQTIMSDISSSNQKSAENSWLRNEVQKTNHRWLNSTRWQRLFNSSERNDR